MNEITIPKTHAIVTYSKTHYLITSDQHKRLMVNGWDAQIEIDGNVISGRNIAEVMTIEKYFETYPDRKPEPKKEDQFKKYDSVVNKVPVHGLPSLMRGLGRYIQEQADKGIVASKAIALYERYEKRTK